MAYAVYADLAAKLSTKLTLEISAESGTSPDTGVLTAVLAQAEDEINKRIGGRYQTPVTGNAETLEWMKSTSLEMAPWLLYQRRGYGENDSLAAAARAAYKEALEWLDKVADGTRDLPGATPRGDLTTTTTGQWTSFTPLYTSTAARSF